MSADGLYLLMFTFGLVAFISGGTYLLMGIVYLLDKLGFNLEILKEDQINTDFWQRLQDGETLTKDNMFSNE